MQNESPRLSFSKWLRLLRVTSRTFFPEEHFWFRYLVHALREGDYHTAVQEAFLLGHGLGGRIHDRVIRSELGILDLSAFGIADDRPIAAYETTKAKQSRDKLNRVKTQTAAKHRVQMRAEVLARIRASKLSVTAAVTRVAAAHKGEHGWSASSIKKACFGLKPRGK
jgi:hypothetical protein